MDRLPISVCLISGAEERRIGRALRSVAGWVQEIVVVLNAEVTDGTQRIAEGLGARVIREPWKGYVAQKNSAAQKATQPWVLGIDSDEVVSEALRDQIVAAVRREEAVPQYAAYRFPRCSRYFGGWVRHGDWYPDLSTRLWRAGKAEWQGDEPHDFLAVQGEVGRLSGDLYHYSMDSIEHQIQKTIRYADIFAAHCQKHRRRVSWSDLFIRPFVRFFRSYIIKLGFLDGWRGYAVAFMVAFYTFLRYFKALQAQSNIQIDQE